MSVQWRTALSLIKLIEEVTAAAPKRHKENDGTIGDERHQKEKSDHNPNARGVVCAMDITHDPVNKCDAGKIAEAIRVAKDPRISYVIFNGRMFSFYRAHGIEPWVWRPYSGEQHEHHVHISVRDDVADDHPWTIS